MIVAGREGIAYVVLRGLRERGSYVSAVAVDGLRVTKCCFERERAGATCRALSRNQFPWRLLLFSKNLERFPILNVPAQTAVRARTDSPELRALANNLL